MAGMLELFPSLLAESHTSRYPVYSNTHGLHCTNSKCVTRLENEARYVIPKFWIVDRQPLTVRCVYCDFEYEPRIVSRGSTKKYTASIDEWQDIYDRSPRDLVLYLNEQEAIDAGHELRRGKRRTTSSK
jgi:Aspartate carbamoyltransferase regulatory chain, metal binding domain